MKNATIEADLPNSLCCLLAFWEDPSQCVEDWGMSMVRASLHQEVEAMLWKSTVGAVPQQYSAMTPRNPSRQLLLTHSSSHGLVEMFRYHVSIKM